jgi:hypothetical protein
VVGGNKFPDDIMKYIKFKDPVTGVMEYYRQTGPVYGEAGAPVRWENTIAPKLQVEGYVRGCNEPAVYYHSDRDVLLLTYVDDLMYDGEEDDIQRSDDRLEDQAPRTPICAPIDTASEALPDFLKCSFMTAVGCLGWLGRLVETGRPDAAYAHSRANHLMRCISSVSNPRIE